MRILVADDDLFYRRIISEYLTNMGYEVVIASNGTEALNLWQQQDENPFGCLILDVYMPGISGVELIEKIMELNILKGKEKQPPVIIVTSDNSLKIEIMARQLQVFSFLLKPFEMKDLGRVVKKALKAV